MCCFGAYAMVRCMMRYITLSVLYPSYFGSFGQVGEGTNSKDSPPRDCLVGCRMDCCTVLHSVRNKMEVDFIEG